MIGESVAFLVGAGKRSIYDAEHFFDGFRDDPEYALACVTVALEAGAENVTLCDTNGSSLPGEVQAATAQVVEAVGGDGERIGIHTHDDAGCGVANSVVAVEAGARLVQGTMNGYGERCGNANLVSILPSLQLKLGFECVSSEQLGSADRGRSPHRRDLQRRAGAERALRRPERVRPQGRHARGGGRGRREHVRAPRSCHGRERPHAPDLGARRQEHRAGARRGIRLRHLGVGRCPRSWNA